MDEDVLVQELVNRLTFEVEPLGTDDVIISPNRNGTPLNVKVRVRNKDEPKLIQRGIVPLPRGKPATIPERIQLIGSDQTIISFNVFMEATSSKESSPETRKRGFHFFKLGGCLGTSYDEDDGPYLPGSSNKDALRTNRSSKSASLIIDEVENLSDRHKFNSVPRNRKGLFGQCKPGGCLDPPFGEDKYPHSLQKVQPETNLKQPLKKIKDKKEKINVKGLEPVKTPMELNEASKSATKSEDESKSVLNLYPRSDEDYPITSQYSNSIITYPPCLTSSQTQNNEQSMEKRSKNKSFDYGSPRSSYEYPETYFIPPKDVIRQKEEERRYSKELSKDEIKFNDDDRNKNKIGLGTFRPSIDKNSTAVDRLRDKETTKQELIKQNDLQTLDSTHLTYKKDGENKGNTDEGPESSKVDSNDKNSNREIETHDTYPSESGCRFAGNKDDIDELETMSYNIDTMKGTRRFGGYEDDTDKLQPTPYDTDAMKGTQRLEGNEDDIDKLATIPHDTEKGARRFGRNEDDMDQLQPTPHDTDPRKGTRRFEGNEDDINQLQPTPHDTDAMKGTRRFEGNEGVIDKLEMITHDTEKGARRFGGNEDDMNQLQATPYDTDAIKGTRRFEGNENDIDKLQPTPYDTDAMKGTQRLEGNEDDIDKLATIPHDTEKGARRFGGNEDDMDQLQPTPHDTDARKGTRRFEGNEDDIDKLETIPHDIEKGTRRCGGNEDDMDQLQPTPYDTDAMKGTRRFEGNKDDIDKLETIPHDTEKVTRRFGGNEDDINQLQPTPRDTDAMKGTRRFEGNEGIIDKLEMIPHDTEKGTRRFGGNEDDMNQLQATPYDTDAMKGTRRFEGNENDIDKLETIPHDTEKGTRRFGRKEDDMDQLQPTPHDADAMKGTRRFGRNEDDIDKLEPMSHDTDTIKGTHRFGENEDNIDKLVLASHGTDTMKGTRRFGENEHDIDQLEPMPHDIDTIKGTCKFGGDEDAIDQLQPTPYDTDAMKGTRIFGGNEDDIDKLETIPHDTEKDTRRFGGNEDDADQLQPTPHDSDKIKGTRRFGENEDNIVQLEPMPHDTYTMKGTHRFGGNESDMDEQEAIPQDTNTMKSTQRFGENEDDIDKPEPLKSVNVETTPTTPEQNSTADEESKEEQKSFTEKNAVKKHGITNYDQVLLTTFEKLDTTHATKENLSSDSILSENKEFATSSIESIDSGEHLTNDKLKEEILNNQTKDLYSEKVSPPWENIQNEMLQKRRSSAIFQKTPFVEITHDEISKSNPLRRNTFTIIDSTTSLQKQIEEISTQRNVIENSEVDNGNVSVIVETKTYFEPGLRSMTSDTKVNVLRNTRSPDSLSYIHDISINKNVQDKANSSRNNPNAEQTELHETKNGLDIQRDTNPTIDNSLFDNSTIKANITSDTQFSTVRNHADEINDVYGFSDIGDIPPDSALKDELVDKTIKEKPNSGTSVQDATLQENLESLSLDKTVLEPKVLDESKTILVNLSFQSYVDANEKRVIQTLNPLIKPHPRYKDDKITVFQSYINYGNEIRIPVNPQHDLILNLFKKNQTLEDINKDRAEKEKTGTANSEDTLKKNLAVIYETGLIPLYSVIKDLIEEINTLTAQQELLKAKVGRAKRSKSLRLIPVINKCGCRRN